MTPRVPVYDLCTRVPVYDGCYSPEAQGREKSRKIESGLLPQFRIPRTNWSARALSPSPRRAAAGAAHETGVVYGTQPSSEVRAES